MKNLSKQSMELMSGFISNKEVLRVREVPCSDYAQSLFLILSWSLKQKNNADFSQFKELSNSDIAFLEKTISQYNGGFQKDFFKLNYNKPIYMETTALLFLLSSSEKKWTDNELSLLGEFALRKITQQKVRDQIINKLVFHYKALNEETDKTFDAIFDSLVQYILKINFPKFSYKYINQTLFISSVYDKWYCEFNTYNDQIILYHANKRHDVNKYHLQKTFKGHFATIENILSYIQHHDSYVINERYNYDYVSKILNKKRKTKFS